MKLLSWLFTLLATIADRLTERAYEFPSERGLW